MLKQRHEESILFDGEDYLFKKYLMNCDYYFEYGVGASTRWVLENTKSKIISVDTDKKWINTIDVSNKGSRIKLNWINLGDLENWARLTSMNKETNILNVLAMF